jgi:5-methylcytosine-specific restriction endonuclease McrA
MRTCPKCNKTLSSIKSKNALYCSKKCAGDSRNDRRFKRVGSGNVKYLRDIVIELLGSYCKNCGAKSNIRIDHIESLQNGGSNKASNIQLLCVSCHNAKNVLDRIKYLKQKST